MVRQAFAIAVDSLIGGSPDPGFNYRLAQNW